MENETIFFLPTPTIPAFMAEKNLVEKLRIGMKALSESHRMEYNDDNSSDEYEPYIALRGYNIPTHTDVDMMVDYLNELAMSEGAECEPFYLDASPFYDVICVCYTPELLSD